MRTEIVHPGAQGKCIHNHVKLDLYKEGTMIDQKTIDEVADSLSKVIPDSVKTLKSDIENNMRAVLESSLRNMNLVSREEFDVQTALLQRSMDKLKQLEQQIAEIEQQNK